MHEHARHARPSLRAGTPGFCPQRWITGGLRIAPFVMARLGALGGHTCKPATELAQSPQRLGGFARSSKDLREGSRQWTCNTQVQQARPSAFGGEVVSCSTTCLPTCTPLSATRAHHPRFARITGAAGGPARISLGVARTLTGWASGLSRASARAIGQHHHTRRQCSWIVAH